MSILIVYYSRTGYTKKVAEKLTENLGAQIEEIKDKNKREGLTGYLTSGKEATQKKMADIENTVEDPGNYDLVIIGTPVWVGTMASGVRTYIHNNKDKFVKVAFFTTQGAIKEQRVFNDMKELTGLEPVAKMIVGSKEAAKNNYEEKLKNFVKEIEQHNN